MKFTGPCSYVSEDKSSIMMTAVYDTYAEPFQALRGISGPVGDALELAISGELGPIADYVPPPPVEENSISLDSLRTKLKSVGKTDKQVDDFLAMLSAI